MWNPPPDRATTALDGDFDPARLVAWRARLGRWSVWLERAGLMSMAAFALDAGEPLAALGAGALWTAQPVLALFVPGALVGDLARLLADPAGYAWLRTALLEGAEES
jgi:hypothetical protein